MKILKLISYFVKIESEYIQYIKTENINDGNIIQCYKTKLV